MSLSHLFSSGRAIDLVLAFMVMELVVLLWRRRRARIDVFLALAPGACLLIALRAALTGAGWMSIAAFVALSLPVHLADLARRRL
jgi:hypothetical protein